MDTGDNPSGGFTIVEVIIVLAVSSLLAVAALLLVNGRQSEVQFQTSITQAQQQMQQYINEVASGYYPDTQQFTCSLNPGVQNGGDPRYLYQPTIVAGSSSPQGTNVNCVFMGTAIQFAVNDDVVNPNYTQYRTIPIVGARVTSAVGNASSTQNVTSVAEADPIVIAPGRIPGASGYDDSHYVTLPTGMKIVSFYYNGNTANTLGSIAIMSSLGGYSGSQLTSGSQTLNLYRVSGTQLNQQSMDAVDAMDTNRGGNYVSVSSVSVCISSGTTTQSGLITIGGNSNTLAGSLGVTVQIFGNLTCS